MKSYEVVLVKPKGCEPTGAYNSLIWMHSGQYKELFGMKRKDDTSTANRTLVKITHGNQTIYRKIEMSGANHVGSDSVGLSYDSMSQLGIDPGHPDGTVKVAPAAPLGYLWHHPDIESRYLFHITIGTFAAGLLIGLLF